jgi:hypothetical protein
MMMEGGADSMMMDGAAKKGAPKTGSSDMMMENASLNYGGMVLRRAAELEQPAGPGHFLIEFGQSPRNLIDGSSKIGSVPQVLMMMNGRAQEMLTNSQSLIFRTMEKVKPSDEKADTEAAKLQALFMSVLNRRPTEAEMVTAKKTVADNSASGHGDIIWALINTREFIFVQ